MKAFKEFLTNNLKMVIDKDLLPDILNYLMQTNFNIYELTLRKKEGKIVIETTNKVITIDPKIDKDNRVGIQEKSIIMDENSIFNDCQLIKAITFGKSLLDLDINITNAANYYTGYMHINNGNVFGNIYDSEELKEITPDFNVLNELIDDFDRHHVLLTICNDILEEKLSLFVKQNKEEYTKSLLYNKKRNR